MLRQNNISFPYNKIFVIGFLFCSLVSLETWGQEEREMVISESSQVYDDLNFQEDADIFGPEEKPTEIKTSKVPATSIKENKEEQPYPLEGENQVNKEGMSTLSFNLFLYVVDKFKEDN